MTGKGACQMGGLVTERGETGAGFGYPVGQGDQDGAQGRQPGVGAPQMSAHAGGQQAEQ